MLRWLNLCGWLACIVYSTIPSFWILIHPLAQGWRQRKRSPYFVLLPVWIGMWALMGMITARWRDIAIYSSPWLWIPASLLFATGFWLYRQSANGFSAKQLGGVPELHRNSEQRLVTTGIRARVRHPVYLAHLCEMLAWSLGTGLAMCYGLTAFAMFVGAVMIRMEDAELAERFGPEYAAYRDRVPAVLPRPGR
jgi:protein-S-isoprenylcysteine O-methyltransferase Ste14